MAISLSPYLRIFRKREAPGIAHAAPAEAVTLGEFIAVPSQSRLGTLRTRVVLLLTLAAGWTDVLTYLSLGTAQARVFSSFMTGNLLFVGTALVQGNNTLLIRAGLTILVFLAGATLGSISLQRLPERQSSRNWRRCSAMSWARLSPR